MATTKAVLPLVELRAGSGLEGPAPRIYWGRGSPDGGLKKLADASKGSIFLSTDQSDSTAVWVKVATAGATADWAILSGIQTMTSREFDIDNGAGTLAKDNFYFSRAATLLSATLVYTEATDASGAAEANIKLGSVDTGTQYVGATPLQASKAIGATQTLSLASAAVAAGGTVFLTHTGIAATEAGKYYVQVKYIEV